MTGRDEFISIKDIKHNHVNEHYIDESNEDEIQIEGIPIYQIQSTKNSTNGVIINAGIIKEPHDVLIKDVIITNYKCFIISKLYTLEQLKESEEFCRFVMMKIIICLNNKEHTPLAQLCYNFNTVVHKQSNKSILDYLSDNNNKKDLYGFFSITLHYTENDKSKYINLDQFKNYCGPDNIITTLLKWLLDEKVKEILSKLT
ncbi:hypothetical protein QKU48_gp0174 [Fadolivirus algeromassiliense]|jgi:hypothetical protein|uniref:Uncharacterized protein n=1 Tax=Fadolivirus FV1/VV64 TaxID=3070911 RepID=A0A7D3V5C6_9VIRU|nr:hypothetical protein QKU48_gp0174 [Fadolivirus algeromassiliense]QKF93632.1 hypothetical protein Fadolivirus_1_174 [Fadolivirus FV1/VV64]